MSRPGSSKISVTSHCWDKSPNVQCDTHVCVYIPEGKYVESNSLFSRKLADLLSYLSCSVMCLAFSCSSRPQLQLRRTMPCRDMGTLINVLRAGGISILEANE